MNALTIAPPAQPHRVGQLAHLRHELRTAHMTVAFKPAEVTPEERISLAATLLLGLPFRIVPAEDAT